ncbi:MAG: methionyl-tRNA formyltransferase [Planctomycetes bacterium]|nr:methionyl-tRNA formyltransferase [Planctomycetota bacterium]
MKIVLWAKGKRGVTSLRCLHGAGHDIVLVIGPSAEDERDCAEPIAIAESLNIRSLVPDNPNDDRLARRLRSLEPDLFVLAGYGRILKQRIIDIPARMCINLHGGKLPKYRGSSPLNWALINGETSCTLSIVKVDAGIDTGDVLLERTFDIAVDDTIRDLHRIADEHFPAMLLEVVGEIHAGTLNSMPQSHSRSCYYSLRFPDDGLILWDIYTAEQIHNRVRALTEPYPCAFTFADGRRIKLLASKLQRPDHFGEPGRVYRKADRGLLVCALDKCLWITEAVFDDTGEPIFESINRYDVLATVRRSVQALQEARSLQWS